MIGGRNPIPESMIKDYFEKYPPTHTFKPSDFEEQNVLRHKLHRYFNVISDAEKLRGPEKRKNEKPDEYFGTVAQCQAEAEIRIMIGECSDREINCPIAFNFNDEQRKEQWKALRQKADRTEKLIYKRDRPEGYECHYEMEYHNQHWRAMKEIGITLEEIGNYLKTCSPEKWRPGDDITGLFPQELPY